MLTPVINVENVSKQYFHARRVSLRNELSAVIDRVLYARERRASNAFFALDGVTFSVQAGEQVGIIGRNGSGKTTLLRLLAGITQPTSGHLTVRGNFSALIGLNPGFIAELSGRKNIYLSAAIQGVPPPIVNQSIDEIIEFAELGAFIDNPVKQYSSGMQARLGFSIATHFMTQSIFLDEILAVGDIAFQAKCMQRMRQFKAEGRTLLLVTHSPDALRDLCERTLWLDHGRLLMDDNTDAVVTAYTRMAGTNPTLTDVVALEAVMHV